MLVNKLSIYPLCIGCFLWWTGLSVPVGFGVMIAGIYWGYKYGEH